MVDKFDYNDLNVANRICQLFNVAFFPDDWLKLFRQNEPEVALRQYVASFFGVNMRTYDWSEQNEKLMKVAENGIIDNEIEVLQPQLEQELRQTWGPNIDTEKLLRLEQQYNASVSDYNLSTDIQRNMLRKIVRMSLMIDEQLDAGMVDKDLIAQYKNLVKDLTSSAEKAESTSINSVSQLLERMEVLGFRPNFDFGTPRDKIDKVLENIQDYNRDLFLGETLIQEQYEQTKELLQNIDNELEGEQETDEDEDW